MNALARSDLSFVTHGEIEGLTGGGSRGQQQRRRLTKRGLLPEPKWVRADRRSLGFLPEFVLAALVVPVRQLTDQHAALLSAMVEDTSKLYGAASVKRLSEAIREALSELGAITQSAALLDRLTESHRDALDAWRADVATIAELLSHRGLHIESEPGRIVAIRDGIYVIKTLEADITEDHPFADAPFELSDGTWVVRDRVHALSSARDFLLPTSKPELDRRAARVAPEADESDAVIEAMFASIEAAPHPVRRLPHAVDDETRIELAKAPPRLVRVPLELLEGFTPMTRPRA